MQGALDRFPQRTIVPFCLAVALRFYGVVRDCAISHCSSWLSKSAINWLPRSGWTKLGVPKSANSCRRHDNSESVVMSFRAKGEWESTVLVNNDKEKTSTRTPGWRLWTHYVHIQSFKGLYRLNEVYIMRLSEESRLALQTCLARCRHLTYFRNREW